MKVVNMFGGPGTGKSTTAAGLFYFMKLEGAKVELVTEYAKDLVYAGQLGTMVEQQEYIFAEQNWRLQRLASHVDWAIIDSPILLSAVYPILNRKHHGTNPWPALQQFIDLVHAQFSSYDNVNLYLKRTDDYQTWGRDRSLEESVEVDNMIKDILDDNYNYVNFNVCKTVVNQIMTHLRLSHGL